MALPLTSFKTFPFAVPTSSALAYTAPPGYNAIILTAQVVNTGILNHEFSMNLVRTGVPNQPIINDYPIPPNEVLIASGGNAGKLVLQAGDALWISGNSTNLKFTLSVLETLI